MAGISYLILVNHEFTQTPIWLAEMPLYYKNYNYIIILKNNIKIKNK